MSAHYKYTCAHYKYMSTPSIRFKAHTHKNGLTNQPNKLFTYSYKMPNQVRLFENQIKHQDIKIINKPSKNYPKTVRLRDLILNNLVQSL